MEKTGKKENKYGLIGKNISYSFSKSYFKEKFEKLGLSDHAYENFDLADIREFPELLRQTDLKGLNVTIPYKEAVMAFLDTIDENAQKIGAVNTIKITKKGLVGYNTDGYGFQISMKPLVKESHRRALILGTGGASKAVAHVLEEMSIPYGFVSRSKRHDGFGYAQLTEEIIMEHPILVNCTPLGTYPNIHEKPDIPYHYLTANHLLYDLIYNPEKTAFLVEGERKGAVIKNGLEMLQQQAEKAWQIWNS